MLKTVSFYYFNIEIKIYIYTSMNYDYDAIEKTLIKYLPGIKSKIDKKKNMVIKNIIEINLFPVKSEKESFGEIFKNNDMIKIRIYTKLINGYLLLGILRSSIDYFMQKQEIYFLHGAGIKIDDEYVLLFGKRADGKSKICEQISNFGSILSDERVGIAGGQENDIIDEKFIIPIEKIKYILTPKILNEGILNKWPIVKHSLRYELYVELTESIRCCGAFEDRIVFQSLDEEEISKKRAEFCELVSKQYIEASYFIEGTSNDICKFILDNRT